ncbi:hypothetical protein AAG906_029337 [Vitis piasezkii]
MEHVILVIHSSRLSYFLLGFCVDLDDIYLFCMIALLLCDCMHCLSMWVVHLCPYLQSSGYGHFLLFDSYICKCEALCVLVYLVELVCMYGGDDHLAGKYPVSSEVCRGLHTTWVHLRAFRASLVTVQIQYFLIWSPIESDWFFVLNLDSPSWVRVEDRLQYVTVDQFTAAMASIQEALTNLR